MSFEKINRKWNLRRTLFLIIAAFFLVLSITLMCIEGIDHPIRIPKPPETPTITPEKKLSFVAITVSEFTSRIEWHTYEVGNLPNAKRPEDKEIPLLLTRITLKRERMVVILPPGKGWGLQIHTCIQATTSIGVFLCIGILGIIGIVIPLRHKENGMGALITEQESTSQ